jgi:hypothetical protein
MIKDSTRTALSKVAITSESVYCSATFSERRLAEVEAEALFYLSPLDPEIFVHRGQISPWNWRTYGRVVPFTPAYVRLMALPEETIILQYWRFYPSNKSPEWGNEIGLDIGMDHDAD